MFFKLLNIFKCHKYTYNNLIITTPSVVRDSPPSSNADADFEIPTSLKDLGCYTLQDVAKLIKYGFDDYKNKDISDSIQFLKGYIQDSYFWVFEAPIFISLSDKTDKWNHNMCKDDGVYLVVGKIENYFYLYRHLIYVNHNQITCVERKIINKEIDTNY